MADDINITELASDSAPDETDQLLLIGSTEEKLIYFKKLADAILNELGSKTYESDMGKKTLIEAVNSLNSKIESDIADLKAEGIQQVPLFANDISECIDTSKVYLLPDEYVYGYKKGGLTPTFTNLLNTEECELNMRLNSSGGTTALDGYFVTNYISLTPDDVGKYIRYKNANLQAANVCVHYFNSSKNSIGLSYLGDGMRGTDENGDTYVIVGKKYNSSGTMDLDLSSVAYIRLCLSIPSEGIESVIITKDEPIEYTEGKRWSPIVRFVAPTDEILNELADKIGLPLYGTVDENNVITISGNLPSGTYTMKYEDESGNATDIGSFNV